MSDYPKNRTRLALENLDCRALPDAKMLAAVAPEGLAAVPVKAMPAEAIKVTPAAGDVSARSIFPTNTWAFYSVVTIKNTTNARIGFKFAWGNGSYTSYTLAAGETRFFWIKSSGATGKIDYDKSFSSGWQSQKYTLPSKSFFGSKPPGSANGKVYEFRMSGSSGVQLWSV